MMGLFFWLSMITIGFVFGLWLGYQVGTQPDYPEWDDEDDCDDD